jgi:hypothetical protein
MLTTLNIIILLTSIVLFCYTYKIKQIDNDILESTMEIEKCNERISKHLDDYQEHTKNLMDCVDTLHKQLIETYPNID